MITPAVSLKIASVHGH
jgi:hypothetical protein